MNRNNKESFIHRATTTARNIGSKVAAGGTALMASGAAFASTTPGSAIASELSGGKADMGLVFAAVAILIGVLLVWSYVRRSAK